MDLTRRIYQFAYQKTRDAREAEDLSQEILLQLLASRVDEARNREAYVMGVCRHVWARYLARNKPHWEATRSESALDFIEDARRVEEEVESRAEYEELRREIARLSRARREALVMRYFEEKSDAQIARALGISPATVRWHLHKARDELKGRLVMEARNGMRAPVRMEVRHSGSAVDQTLCGLKDDLLTQNIAWACYGPPKRAEEIARELDVPAVYVESKLCALSGMEYMKRIGDRYQTNFFIHTPEYILARARYNYENSAEFGEALLGAARAALPEVRAVGFSGCDLPDAELLWHVLPEIIMRAYQPLTARLHEELGLRHGKPLRRDGTRHWVWARVEPLPKTGDAEFDAYLLGGSCFNIKGMRDGDLEFMQYDFQFAEQNRAFGAAELRNVRLAAQGDREALSSLSRDGYARGGKLLIPFMTQAERRTYEAVLDRAVSQLDQEVLYAPFIGYVREMERYIPAFIDPNERAHRLTSYDAFATPIYLLIRSKRLELPDPNVSRRLCTVVWENGV